MFYFIFVVYIVTWLNFFVWKSLSSSGISIDANKNADRINYNKRHITYEILNVQHTHGIKLNNNITKKEN
jgi:hypothetical protein